MVPCQVMPGVGIVGQPDIAGDLPIEDKHMVTTDSDHTRGWRSTGETKPTCSCPKRFDWGTEYTNSSSAAAESPPWASLWVWHDR
jgi:hypothetical protein